MPWVRAFALWLMIVAAESLHGAVRTLFLAPVVGDFRARQISVFTGTAIIFLVAWLFSRWLRADSARSLLMVGAFWVLLTILFEVCLGRFALGYDWGRIFSDYDLGHGGLLGIGLVAMLFTPLIAAKVRRGVPSVHR